MEKQIKDKELPKGAIMSEEVAALELERWFDFRKVKDKARNNKDEDGKDVMREKMIEGFMYGLLTFFPENGHLIQKLEFKIENESKSFSISELDWKPRFQKKDLTACLVGIKTKDTDGRMDAYIAAITGIDRLKLGSMDFSDYSLSQAIVSYFLF